MRANFYSPTATVKVPKAQQKKARNLQNGKFAVRGVAHNSDETNIDDDGANILHEYGQRKQNLISELLGYEAAEHAMTVVAASAKSASNATAAASAAKIVEQLPADTRMECHFDLSTERGKLEELFRGRKWKSAKLDSIIYI